MHIQQRLTAFAGAQPFGSIPPSLGLADFLRRSISHLQKRLFGRKVEQPRRAFDSRDFDTYIKRLDALLYETKGGAQPIDGQLPKCATRPRS